MFRRTFTVALVLLLTACTGLVDDRSAGEVLDDSVINTRIDTALAQESGRLFVDVATTVFQGRVMLTGSVTSRDSADTAARIANGVSGVTQVINEIQVTDEGGFTATATDVTIETKLKVKLVAADNIRSANYRWRAVNGVVYLLGLAQDQTEHALVLATVKDTQGVKRVNDHTRLRGQAI